MEIFNVKDYGAKGDGKHLDTNAIQYAIDIASKAGGTVFFPAGEFRTGTLCLKSDITLYLRQKAVLSGSTDLEDYKIDIVGCIEAPSFDKCLLYAENEQNIKLCGMGQINGNGSAFIQDEQNPFGHMRPMLIRMVNCKNIILEDVKLQDAASWCAHMILCEDINISKVKISNHGNRNNDGFDLDSCSNVSISNTHISSIDDSICLKSTTDTPCKNIAITNCILSSETAAIKFGTSSKSGFLNVAISNCVIHDCPMGTIKILCVDGGTIRNVVINNITMYDVGSPLFVRLGKRNLTFEKPAENDFYGLGSKNEKAAGRIENLMVSNLIADVTVTEKEKTPMIITGLTDAKIKDVVLSNFNITFAGGGTEADGSRTVEEDPFRYPEQSFFDILPAYGLYGRHIDGLHMMNIKMKTIQPDKRPAVLLEDVIQEK